MGNKREIYKDDITKLIDGKSLDEIIENLKELRNSNYGCEVVKLKHSTNMRPIICLYDVVNEIPGDAIIDRNPEVPENVSTMLNTVYNVSVKEYCKQEKEKLKYPDFSWSNLPLNLFMDTSYYKEVFNRDVDAKEEINIIHNLKTYYKNTRNRVFVRYGEGRNDAVGIGCIAGFTIINLDSIVSDKLDISVFNPYYTKYLIGKQGSKARQLADEINKELGYDRVKKIFFKEIQ